MAKSFKKERFKLKTDILTGSSTLDDWKSLYLLNDDGAIVDGSQEDITFKDPEEIIDEYIKAVDMDRSVPEMERSISDVQSSQTSQFQITEEKAKLVPFQRHYTDILKSDPGGPRSKIMEAQKYVSISLRIFLKITYIPSFQDVMHLTFVFKYIPIHCLVKI